jgi:phenylacetate-CoA ligase
MNPFLNPINDLPLLKNIIFDPGRIRKLTTKQMKRFRDKALKKTVKYAYTVPLYHKKYKEYGVHPDDIKGIDDIIKLPFITKKDLIDTFPDNVVPVGYNKEKAHVVCTSGSTGEPLSFYTDFSTMINAIGITLRIFRDLNLNWRKSKFALVLNYSSNNVNYVDKKVFFTKIKSLFFLENYLLIHVFEPLEDIIKKLDKFKPDMIVSYPVTFQHLAFLKRKGHCKNINPKVLIVGGYLLDEYTRRYVEDTFGCRMFNLYGSAESSGDIAVECKERNWHINQDFYHIEAVDENGELVAPDEKGQIVLTRMFGKGTPFIRYIGMGDWVTLNPELKCPCGLTTQIIKGGIEGKASIILPTGKFLSFNSLTIVSNVLNDLKTFKIKQFQIVQKKIDEIEILLIVDDDLRDINPSVSLIFEKIEKEFVKKVGPGIRVNAREVKEIETSGTKPTPLIISHLRPEEVKKVLESK